MPSFRESRNVELSLLYYLEVSFISDWNDITLCKSYKQVYAKDTSLPIVTVELIDTNTTRLEVGSTTLDNHYLLSINIFARSNAQRLDLADYVKDKLKDGWIHYEHSHESGDNTTLEKTADGRDYVTDWVTDAKIDMTDSTDDKDRYRHNITVRVRYSG